MSDTKVAVGSGSYSHVGDIETAKKVHIYTNGDKYFAGKNFVVNPRQLRDFDAFLNQVTLSLRPTFGAVRAIRTPNAGHRVANLGLLESGKSYVAAGGGKFIKIGYNEIAPLTHKANNANQSPRELGARRKLQVSGRVRKIKLEPLAIMVYANGETMEPARRLLIKPWVERDWESVLGAIDEKIQLRSGAVRRLVEMTTKQEVKEIKDLKSNQYYVAVGAEKYKDLEYGQSEGTLSPRQQQKRRFPHQLPPLKKKSSTNESSLEPSETQSPPIHQDSKAESEPSSQVEPADAAARSKEAVPAPAPAAPPLRAPPANASQAVKDPITQEQPAPSKKVAPAATGASSKRSQPPSKDATKANPQKAPKEEAVAQQKAPREEAVVQQKAPKEEAVVPQKPVKYRRSGNEKKESKEAGSGPASATAEVKNIDLDKDEGGIYKAKAKSSDVADEVIEDKHTKQEIPVDHRDAEEIVEEERPPQGASEAPSTNVSEGQAEPPRESKSSARPSASAGRPVTPVGELTAKRENTRTPVEAEADDPADGEDAKEYPQEAAVAEALADDPSRDVTENKEAAGVEAASFGGYQARLTLAAVSAASDAIRADTPPTKYVREERAAVVIQSNYRGYDTRKKLRKERVQENSVVTEEPSSTLRENETATANNAAGASTVSNDEEEAN